MFLSWCCRVSDWWQEGFACFLSNYSQCNCCICLPPHPVCLYPNPLPVSHSFLATFYILCFLFPPGIAKALECELGCLPRNSPTSSLPPLFAPPVCVYVCAHVCMCVCVCCCCIKQTVRPLQDFHRSPRQTSLKLLTWQTHFSGLSRPCRPTSYLLTFGIVLESETSNRCSLFQQKWNRPPLHAWQKNVWSTRQGLHTAAHSLQQQKCTSNTDQIIEHVKTSVHTVHVQIKGH